VEQYQQTDDVFVVIRVQLLQEHDFSVCALRICAVLESIENLL
jgi:hypothetical protein